VTLIFFTASSAWSRDQEGSYTVFTVGTILCATITENVKRNEMLKYTYMAYIEGFLTAINMMSTGKSDFFEGTNALAHYKFVLQYCKNNPLEKVAAGIETLVLRYKANLSCREER